MQVSEGLGTMSNGERRPFFEMSRRGVFGLVGGAIAGSAMPGAVHAYPKPAPKHVQVDTPSGMYDPLTRLPNEALFLDRTDTLLRLNDMALSVVIIDIANFDAMQRVVSEPILNVGILTLAKRQERFLEMDWVHTVARVRDRQFGLLMTDGSEGSVRSALALILRAIRAPMCLGDRDRMFSVNVGLMSRQHRGQRAAELIETARKAASA